MNGSTVTRWVAMGVARLRVNEVTKCAHDGGTYFVKRRRWWAEPVVRLANHYLQRKSVGVRWLPCAEWLDWELRVYRQLLNRNPRVQGLALWLPELRGRTLSSILSSPVSTDEQRVSAVGLALQSLAALHRRNLAGPDGVKRAFTHGDATTHNVMVTESNAQWIDFETLADAKRSTVCRRADDVRALFYSAAYCWFGVDAGKLASLVATHYDAPGRVDVMETLGSERRASNLYELAQAPLPAKRRGQLELALRLASSNMTAQAQEE